MKIPFADTNALLRDAIDRWRREGLLSPADAGRLLEDVGPSRPWGYWIRALAVLCLICLLCAAVLFFCDDAVVHFIRHTEMHERLAFFAGLALILRLAMLKAGKGLFFSALGLLACFCSWAGAVSGCNVFDLEAPCWLAAAAFCTLTPGSIPAFFALGALAASLLGTPVPDDVLTLEARCATLGMLSALPALAGWLPRRWLNPALALLSGSFCVLALDGRIISAYHPDACALAGLATGCALFAWGASRHDPVPRRWGSALAVAMLAAAAARHLDCDIAAAGIFALASLACGLAVWMLSRRRGKDKASASEAAAGGDHQPGTLHDGNGGSPAGQR